MASQIPTVAPDEAEQLPLVSAATTIFRGSEDSSSLLARERLYLLDTSSLTSFPPSYRGESRIPSLSSDGFLERNPLNRRLIALIKDFTPSLENVSMGWA